MDEVFHGPQARDYCRGAFATWHPKITTFPGIYYLGTLYGWTRWALQALVAPLELDAACSTPYLRSINVLLSAACLIVLRELLTAYRRQICDAGVSDTRTVKSDAAAPPPPPPAAAAVVTPAFHALILALYPLHWFFSFLFYTDVASLLFLLLAQLQVARRRYLLAAAAASLAVLCRQTNAVWAAFLFGEAALSEVGMDWAPDLRRPSRRRQPPAATGGSGAAAAASTEAAGAMAPETDGLVAELQAALGALWGRRGELAARLWPLLLPPAGFVAFLLYNDGSVVLGDKEAHKPVRHGAQLLYFAGWVTAMLAPQLLPSPAQRRAVAAAAARQPLAAAGLAVAAVVATAAVGHVSTMVHPYMLADNRHYVFYLWRRLLGRSAAAKFALAPLYAAAWAVLLAALRRRVTWLWAGGFLACLTAQLLPAWLLELRYFTPGFFMIACRLAPPSRSQAAMLLLLYGTINVATLCLFLFRPYEFADGSVARFIW